jgi:hypothetical protein
MRLMTSRQTDALFIPGRALVGSLLDKCDLPVIGLWRLGIFKEEKRKI